MKIEYNGEFVRSHDSFAGGRILVAPAINEDYWIIRVPVSKNQAIVCFPKFGTIGIGFQHEEDWNTNLPYTSEAEKIYDHIKHNKGNKNIRRETCIAAILLLQKEIENPNLNELGLQIKRSNY